MKRFLHILPTCLVIILLWSCSSDFQRIERLYNDQEYQAALDELDSYLFFHITDLKALHMRARSHEELGETLKAKKDYERIIALDDEYAQAYAGLGKLLFEEKNYNKAESYLLRAASLESNDFDILYLLGRTQLMTEKYSSSENFLIKAREINPEFAKVHFYEGMAKAMRGDVLGCAVSFNKYVQFEPDQLVGRYNRGFALMRAGYVSYALEDFEAILKVNPNHVEAIAKKGYCLAKLGDPQGCLYLQEAANKGSEYAQNQREICV
ncbi:tetratricopeptide repeat protein [Algoriphagus sp.]|uniref:tetratricopeptide repeat protein n=1 Tax=Algoriphagus sp. TaxID=1872435 RepID=UPI0025F70F04|nr:tetratricopeptide repeat protein [Algoriphagus sp.]